MNLQTGLKEAKLMKEDMDTEPDGTSEIIKSTSDNILDVLHAGMRPSALVLVVKYHTCI